MVMERLTEKTVGCFEYALKDHKAVPGEFDTYDAFFDYSMAVKRLGHYEDTGLEPEDLKKAFNETAILKLAAQALSTTPDHLRYLLQAEQDEQLVVLPCKLGDDVWFVRKFGKRQCINRAEVSCINIDFRGEVFVSARRISGGYIGKTVFLTREEAEAALVQEGGTNEDSGGL